MRKRWSGIVIVVMVICMVMCFPCKSYAQSDAEVYAEILPFVIAYDEGNNMIAMASSVPVFVENQGIYLVSAYIPEDAAYYMNNYMINGSEQMEEIYLYYTDANRGYSIFTLENNTTIEKGFNAESISEISAETALLQITFDSNTYEYKGCINYCAETNGYVGVFAKVADGSPMYGAPIFNNETLSVVGVTYNEQQFVTMDAVYEGLNAGQILGSGNGTGSSGGNGSGTTTGGSNSGGGIPVIAIVAVIGAGAGSFFYLRKKKGKDNDGSETIQSDSTVNSLVGVGGEHAGMVIPINEPIVFGRDKNRCNMMFPSSAQGISSLHCQVSKINEKIEVTDLGSTYGTFLDNGTKLTPHVPQQLMPGQGFYLADRKYSYRIQ